MQTGHELTAEQLEQINKEKAEFAERVKQIENDLKEVAETHGIGIVAGIHIKDVQRSGVHMYGELSYLEQAGLAKLIENTFNQ